VEVREEYQVKISNMFTAFKNLDDDVNFNRAWEDTENIKSFHRKPRLLQTETA
jgi:hypothetical protein